MHYVYILCGASESWMYIGYTNDLRHRLAMHRGGKVESTKEHLPVRLVYYEAYASAEDAKNREKRLKYFGKAYGQLKRRMEQSLRPPSGKGAG
ncbi:MAG: GIY-YIG nuclease family protein [Nitrospirae bacterium]|nr:GIY-YIG nuclease family protein [Nitrospirota bacterium]